jgi:nucleotide-binding universal stress UspA family protein
MAYVVVGVDGSEQSINALRLAAQEARWRSARLHAVYVFEPVLAQDVATVATMTGTAWPASSVTMLQDAYRRNAEQQEQAREHAVSQLEHVLEKVSDAVAGVVVERTVVSDEHPAAALMRIAANADLLVVGSRGFGGFKGLLLGSVSQQCVQHATCPVLVVRPRRHGSSEGGGWNRSS